VRESTPSFEEFFYEHYEPVRRSLVIALSDPVLAEELAQDAFTRALAGWRRVSKMQRPAGWVYIVALRAGRRQRSAGCAAIAIESTTPDAPEAVLDGLVLAQALERLPERQRIAIVLRFLADLPLAEVAAAMDCAIGTVKSTLHAALLRLGVEMSEQEDESDAPR